MLLPQDRLFISLMKDKGINLSEEDYFDIVQFTLEQQEDWQFRLAQAETPYYDVQNGKILAIIAFAVVGILLAPLLGVSVVLAALVGAAIGYKLFFGTTSQPKKVSSSSANTDTPVQTYGFNSAPSIAPIGGVLPLIFTSTLKNPNGGIRISGNLLNTRVETFGGLQKFYGLYSIGLGTINAIDINSTTINQQPISNFFTDEVTPSFNNGTAYQLPLTGFDTVYSQCISLSTNNLLGLDKRGTHIGATSDTSVLTVATADFEAFAPNDRYLVGGSSVSITSKNRSNNTLNLNGTIHVNNNDPLFCIYKASYTTSRACSGVDINLVAQFWARDKDNKLLNFGSAFYVAVDGVTIGIPFLISNNVETDIRRSIKIRNLVYKKHTFTFTPISYFAGNYCLPLSDIKTEWALGAVENTPTLEGRNIMVIIEQSTNTIKNNAETNSIIGFTNKETTSSDRGAPIQITTINEVSYPGDLGQSNMSNYKNQCLASLTCIASSRLQSDPAPSFLIASGLQGREHLSAGYAASGSTPNILYDPSATFTTDISFYGVLYLRNLETGVSLPFTILSQTQLQTSLVFNWNVGDRYVVFRDNQALVYFPDIYVWTLSQRVGGLGYLLPDTQIYDFFIDFVSIVRARKFCISNNFYWDGVISEITSWASWATTESLGSLLHPTKIGGKFGLIPETETNVVMVFNASNIIDDSYVEDYAPRPQLNCVHVVYTNNTVNNTVNNATSNPIPTTVSIMYSAAYYGADSLQPETIKMSAITNEAQAIRLGQVYLQSKNLQNFAITFITGLQGYSLREGDLIIVQHVTTEINKEFSGFVIETQPIVSGFQMVRLSSPSQPGLTNVYSAALYRLRDGSKQTDLYCQVVTVNGVNWLQLAGLTAPMNVGGDGYTGDYVVIGVDIPNKRTFRVQKLEPQADGSVKVTAVIWSSKVLSTNGLFTVN